MGFLDNSGDIILDAVLTDTGRMRLARGDGSFKIAKFAFADDEINYGSFNADHASGSAYYDLEILQTPILEAFTNNTATMKSKLISLTNNNLLYLPVMIINDNHGLLTAPHQGTLGSGSFLVMVDADTVTKQNSNIINFPSKGTLDGVTTGFGGSTLSFIRIDQGLHTIEVSAVNQLDQSLREDQFIVEMDHRLGKLHATAGSEQTFSFVDDDQIASYFVSGDPMVTLLDTGVIGVDDGLQNEIILGPRGNSLKFKIKSSTNLESNTYLFEQIGGLVTCPASSGPTNETYYYIDATVRVVGATTGYRIDIPIRYIKYKETT